MAKFNWHDVRGKEGIGYVRALRTMLTNHLPELIPELRQWAADAFEAELINHAGTHGRLAAPGAGIMRKTICVLNAKSFFGYELGQPPPFYHTTMNYADNIQQDQINHSSTLLLTMNWKSSRMPSWSVSSHIG